MLPVKLLSVVLIASCVQRSFSSGVCGDLVVALPDSSVLLNYFDHFSAIGRYKRVGEQRRWKQLHGRHQVLIHSSTNSDVGPVEQLSFLATSTSSETPEYIGLNATFKSGLDFSNDDFLKRKLHTQLFSWDVYNHTTLRSLTSYTSQFDELYIYCLDDEWMSSYPVCTGDRVLNVTLSLTLNNGSVQTINDPKVNVFKHSGTYRENRPIYVQDDDYFLIFYTYLSLRFFLHYHTWVVMYKPTSVISPLTSVLYISDNVDDASPFPELSNGTWTRFNPLGIGVSSPIQCAARLTSCSLCNPTHTDTCVRSTINALYYCVCSIGYEGETCDTESAICHRPPIDIVGRVPEYYHNGPFYSGEIITVSCFAGYSSLLSRWKYTTACTSEGRWTVEGACLDYSLIDPSVDRTNLTQVVSSLIEEVEKRVIADADPTLSPFNKYICQDWFITMVLAIWAGLPLLTMLIGGLVHKYRLSGCSGETSVWRMISIHTYVWLWIGILYEIVSLSIGLSSSPCYNVFFYLNIYAVVVILALYVCHVLTMLLSPEMSVISKNYPVLADGYFDALTRGDKPQLSVTVECYHEETITKKVRKTNTEKVICEEEVTFQEPVVTKVYTQVFSYESCQDVTTPLTLTPSTVVEVKLVLQVSFADNATENAFYAMKNDLQFAHTGEDDKVNTFQVVRLTTTEHQLRKDLDVTIYGIVGPRRFYHNIWFFRAMMILLMGVPLRYYLSRWVITKPQTYSICKEIQGVSQNPRAVRVSSLN